MEIDYKKLIRVCDEDASHARVQGSRKILDFDPKNGLAIAQLIHEVKNAVLSFNGAVAAIERGYRFDDASAEARIRSLKNAARATSQAADLLDAIWSSKEIT